MDELVCLSGKGRRHQNDPVALCQMPCDIFSGKHHAAGRENAVFPAERQHPVDHARQNSTSQLFFAVADDCQQGRIRRTGTSHIAERLLLVDLVQRQGQHFGAALMMPPTASLIFRAT